MIYSNILNPKFRNLLRVFVLILVSVYSLTLYSCQTSYTETYTPEQLRANEENEKTTVLEIETKTDSTINLENYDAKYYKHSDKSRDIISYNKTDTIYLKTQPVKEYKVTNKTEKISIKDILYANVEKNKTNVPLTILAVTGTIIIIGVIMFAIAMSSFKMDFSGLGSGKFQIW